MTSGAIALVILASAWVVGDGAGGLTYAAFYALAAAVGCRSGSSCSAGTSLRAGSPGR